MNCINGILADRHRAERQKTAKDNQDYIRQQDELAKEQQAIEAKKADLLRQKEQQQRVVLQQQIA